MELKIQIFLTLFAYSVWYYVSSKYTTFNVEDKHKGRYGIISFASFVSFLVVVWSA